MLCTDFYQLKKAIKEALLGGEDHPKESLFSHCHGTKRYEEDNMTRDQVLTHIKDKNLKSKLYRSEELTLAKLLEIVSQYHDKDALILVQPKDQIN